MSTEQMYGRREQGMTSPSEIDVLGLLWMLQLDRPRPCKQESRIPATFQRAGPEHATELAQAMGFDHPASVLQRLSMGKHCYIVRVKGKLAGYGWITYDTEDIGEFGVSIRLNEGEAYIWDCATLPAYRGQRSSVLAFGKFGLAQPETICLPSGA